MIGQSHMFKKKGRAENMHRLTLTAGTYQIHPIELQDLRKASVLDLRHRIVRIISIAISAVLRSLA